MWSEWVRSGWGEKIRGLRALWFPLALGSRCSCLHNGIGFNTCTTGVGSAALDKHVEGVCELLFMAEKTLSFYMCIYNIFFIHSFVDAHLSWFPNVTVKSSVAVNTGVQASL